MKLQAGMLDRRITIKRRAMTEDELGQTIGEWSITICRVWANYRAPTGMGSIGAERVAGGREISTNVCSWRIRYRTDILANDRVEEADGTVWDIKQVLPDRRDRQHVDLVCETGAAEV